MEVTAVQGGAMGYANTFYFAAWLRSVLAYLLNVFTESKQSNVANKEKTPVEPSDVRCTRNCKLK